MARVFILLACVASAFAANVLEVLKARREPTLLSLIQTAGLESALSGEGKYLKIVFN